MMPIIASSPWCAPSSQVVHWAGGARLTGTSWWPGCLKNGLIMRSAVLEVTANAPDADVEAALVLWTPGEGEFASFAHALTAAKAF